MPGRAYVAVTTPQGSNEVSLDTGNYWTIGRGSDNILVFDDNAMSRRHAVIQRMDGGDFYFIDLGSRNGSSINGRRVTIPVALHDGDSMVCGQSELVFHNTVVAPEGPKPSQISAPGSATRVLYARTMITVLVVDIRDFTPLTRQVDENILAQAIGTWFRESGVIVKRYGSWGDKYIGDAVMAVWTHGAAGPQQSDICQILQALSEIQRVTSGLHEKFPLPHPIRVGAGINTGPSMIGNTGGQDTPEFSPLGDNVNAAFRLETATKKSGMDIALGHTTYDYLSSAPGIQQYFEKRSVELKGYEQLMEAWFTSYAKLEEFLRNRTVGV